MIKWRILRWEDDPGVSGRVPRNHRFLQDGGRKATVIEPDTMMEAEVRVMQGHEPRDVGSL